MKHIDCSAMNVYRRLAKELLKGEILTDEWSACCAGGRRCDLPDAGQLVERHMNADGSMPWARFKGLWDACYAAGDIERAFEAKRFAVIRNQFEAWGLLDWESVYYRQGAAAKWRFSDYLLGVIDEYLEKESHPCAGTSTTGNQNRSQSIQNDPQTDTRNAVFGRNLRSSLAN